MKTLLMLMVLSVLLLLGLWLMHRVDQNNARRGGRAKKAKRPAWQKPGQNHDRE